MRQQIQAISEQLRLTREDNVTFVVDTSAGRRNVYVVVDVPNGRWAAYIREPKEGPMILMEGALSAAGLSMVSIGE